MTFRRTLLALSLAAVLPAQAWDVHDPRPLVGGALCYDSLHGRGLYALDTGSRFEVHEWSGERWTPRFLGDPNGPGASGIARRSLGFSPALRRSVLLTDGLALTWAWDGAAFSLLPAPPFTPRWTAMAFDAAQQLLVVFSATATSGVNSTWTFDGTTWTQIAANLAMPTLITSMAWDGTRGRMVLRGDSATFEWSGTAWVGGTTTVSPPANLAVVYDPRRGKVVLPSVTGTMWEWDGTDWSPFAAPTITLGPNRLGRFFFDDLRQELVLFDDWTGGTYRQTATGWEARQLLPSTGESLSLTADHMRGDVVVVGNPAILNPNPPPSTSRWSPAGWQRLGDLGLPVRSSAAQADRDLQGVVYRFGGLPPGSYTPTDDLWAFDGTAWAQIVAPNAPVARYGGALAVDVARQRLVAFGGYGGTYWNDTREFDGAQWYPRYPAHAPSPRTGHAMCWASNLGRVVLFGGAEAPSGTQVRDFWSWDGTDWTQLPAPTTLPVSWFAMADHAASNLVVLTLGAGLGQVTTWGFDGVTWAPIDPAPPGANLLVGVPRIDAVYAPYAGAVLASTPSTTSSLGSGCPGSAAAPTLRPFGRPWIGNRAYALDLDTALPGTTPALVAFGFAGSPTSLPGGCTLQLAPAAVLFVAATDCCAPAPLPVPYDPALRGVQIAAQGAVLDLAAAHGFALSAAVVSTIGE